MARKITYEQSLVTDRWISFDPLDNEIIERLFKKNIREGEEKLILAVLSDAIEHFQKYAFSKDEKGRKLFQEAEKWFLEKDRGALFSFEYICETLQLHPDYIRKGLMAWKEARLKTSSLQAHPASRPKLARGRTKHPAIRLSKTT
jgi:hypothetical protein